MRAAADKTDTPEGAATPCQPELNDFGQLVRQGGDSQRQLGECARVGRRLTVIARQQRSRPRAGNERRGIGGCQWHDRVCPIAEELGRDAAHAE